METKVGQFLECGVRKLGDVYNMSLLGQCVLGFWYGNESQQLRQSE